jgi:hypothetical protein
MAQNRRVNPKAFFGELLQHDVREIAFRYAVEAYIGDATSKEKLTESGGQLASL